MGIDNIMLNLDLNYMSVVWGFLGSSILIGDVLKIRTDEIIEDAGTYEMYNPSKIVRRHLQTRYNTVSAGILLFLSYSSSLINTGFFLRPKIDTIVISGVIALLAGFIIKWLFERYAKYKIDKTVAIVKKKSAPAESSALS